MINSNGEHTGQLNDVDGSKKHLKPFNSIFNARESQYKMVSVSQLLLLLHGLSTSTGWALIPRNCFMPKSLLPN